jgi:hypothetical protein
MSGHPWFIPSDAAVVAHRCEHDGVFQVRGVPGSDAGLADEIAVLAGEWLLFANRKENSCWTLSDAEFARDYRLIEGLAYVDTRRKVSANVHDEGFLSTHWRCKPDGTPLCRADIPLNIQARAVLTAGDAAAGAHLAHLKEIRDRRAASPFVNPDVQADIHLLDAILAAAFSTEPLPETVDPGIRRGALRPDHVPGEIRGLMEMEKGDAPGWHPISRVVGPDLPAHLNPTRALARRIMSTFTGRPLDHIHVVASPTSEEATDAMRVADWVRETSMRLEAPAPDLSAVPGYSAQVELWNRDGLDILVVDDAYMLAVYAWPQDDRPSPSPAPGR